MNPSVVEPPAQRRRALLALFLLLGLVMLPNFVWLAMPHMGSVWASALVTPAALLVVLFAVCGRQAWLACLVLLPFAVLAPMEIFYIASYRRPTSAEVLGTVFATNFREATGFFGTLLLPLLLAMVASLVVALLAVAWCRRAHVGWRHHTRYYALLIIIGTPLLGALLMGILSKGTVQQREHQGMQLLWNLALPVSEGYPFGVVEQLASYYEQWSEVQASVARLDHFYFHAHRARTTPPGKRQIYVLVIGESSRIDRWQLFGYERATTPELAKTSNIVPVTDMVASWPMTVAAVPLMLTRRPIDMDFLKPWDEGTILRAMQEAGYETWWISNQEPIGRLNSLVAVYAGQAQHVLYLNRASRVAAGGYDEVLLAPLREAVNGSGGDEFIVVHVMGSHLPYELRYPPSFDRFRPALEDKGTDVPDPLRQLNSYDNTILYSDHILAAIIAILRDTHAVSALWFSSDHGQNLLAPNCNAWGHGLGTRWDLRVPAFFWYSDSYAAAFPQKLAALRGNAVQKTLTGDLFESLVDTAGIDMPGRKPSQSLLSPSWSYRKRIVHGIAEMDFDDSDTDTQSCDLVLPRKR